MIFYLSLFFYLLVVLFLSIFLFFVLSVSLFLSVFVFFLCIFLYVYCFVCLCVFVLEDFVIFKCVGTNRG